MDKQTKLVVITIIKKEYTYAKTKKIKKYFKNNVFIFLSMTNRQTDKSMCRLDAHMLQESSQKISAVYL